MAIPLLDSHSNHINAQSGGFRPLPDNRCGGHPCPSATQMLPKNPCFYFPIGSCVHVFLTRSHANACLLQCPSQTFLFWSHLLRPAASSARVSGFSPGTCVRPAFVCMCLTRLLLFTLRAIWLVCDMDSIFHSAALSPLATRPLFDSLNGAQADRDLSALKWGAKSSLDAHGHYIDIYSLAKKVVSQAHPPLCPFTH